MIPLQVQAEAMLRRFPTVAALLETLWGWPITESAHFLGLVLLFGSIATWDLRLLGVAREVPMTAFHRLVPFAVLGFAINVVSGVCFLMTAPEQYIYNSAFHLKMACVVLAGVNVVVFYATTYRRPNWAKPGATARLSGAVSLLLWASVIVFGRMITFYRPTICRPGDALGLLATCIVR